MQSWLNLTDEEIVEQIKRSGDRTGFEVLYQRYAHLMMGWCLRYLKNETASQDAVMDIFEQLLTNIDRYSISSFKNWLFLLTRNHCFSRLRKRSTVLMDDLSQLDGEEIMETFDNEHLKVEALEDALHEGIESLKEEQRNCIILFYLKKMSYKEIVQQTGYDLSKVKSHIQNGKRNLRLKLEELPS